MNRQRRRMTSLFAALAIVATGVVVTGSVSPTSADGALGVSVLVSDDHPGMIKVRWTNRPAAVDPLPIPLLRIQWKAHTDGAVEQTAFLGLYVESRDAIVIPNLAAEDHDVTVSALTAAPSTFGLTEVRTITVGVAGPADPCGGVAHLCVEMPVGDATPLVRGNVFLGQSSAGTSVGGIGTSRWLGWVPGDSSQTSSGARLNDGVDVSLRAWFRVRIQATDRTGQIPSRWWSANFGDGDTDDGATYQTATEVLVPSTVDTRARVQLTFGPSTLDGTTLYEGTLTKDFGEPAIGTDDLAERLCAQFFTADGNFAQELCANNTGFEVPGAAPATWKLRLPNQLGGYRLRFVDEANFDPGYVDPKTTAQLLSIKTAFSRQWCGQPAGALQCGRAANFGSARPIEASTDPVVLNAELREAGHLRLNLTGVPLDYSGREEHPVIAYVEDVATGRWFNTYTRDLGDGTWGINAPGLDLGRSYRVSIVAPGGIGIPDRRFYLGAGQGVIESFVAGTPAAELAAPIRTEAWPSTFVLPYVVRVVRPNGTAYGAPSDANDDVCIAVIRRSDRAVMASSCAADNAIGGFDGLLTLQAFPIVDGNPNLTYAAVAWKRNAGGAMVGSPYPLVIPSELDPQPFVDTGFASGFFDRRGLSVPVESLPPYKGVSTANITVVVP